MYLPSIFYVLKSILIGISIMGMGLISCSESANNASSSEPTEVSEVETYYSGINYLKDDTSLIYSETCPNENSYGLKITEVSWYWIELFNTNQSGGNSVCLKDYRLRASKKVISSFGYQEYVLTNAVIPPQSYLVIRFYGNAANNANDLIIMNEIGMYSNNGYRAGFFDLLKANSEGNNETVDFVGFCTDGNNLLATPTTGTFSGCLSFPTSDLQGSFALDENHMDTDSASDWTYRTVVTFGGKNDVTDVTDSDKDGIPDANEQPGSTFAGMPLYDWGARVDQKDIFVHMAFMDGDDYIYNNVQIKEGLTPFKESFENIRTVFLNNGYYIHFDLGNKHSSTIDSDEFNLSGIDHEVPYSVFVDISENAVSSTETPDAVSIILYKNRYMPINRLGIFHFGLIANILSFQGYKYDSVGGIAELPGNDFLIFNGTSAIQNWQEHAKHNYLANIVMHEFGHNLNLHHGGNEDQNYKPNYFSIMNYGYSYYGVPVIDNTNAENFYNRYLLMSGRIGSALITGGFLSQTFNMNYSYGTMPDLDETSLTEKEPFGEHNGIGDVDWNGDGYFNTDMSEDLNPADTSANNLGKSVLKDYNDWGNLLLPFDQSQLSYGNLKNISYNPNNRHIKNQSDNPPKGAALVNEEGSSPYIIDYFPPLSILEKSTRK